MSSPGTENGDNSLKGGINNDPLFKKKLNEFNEERGKVNGLEHGAKARIEKDWENAQSRWKEIKGNPEIISIDGKPSIMETAIQHGPEEGAKKKRYPAIMDVIAYVGLAGLVILLILSAVCAGGYCGVAKKQVVSNGVVVLDPITGEPVTEQVVQNLPLQILESQFMLALIGGVIAPMATKILKEKYDIDIDAAQISMIMTDAVKAVKLYQNESNRLRDKKTGRVKPEYASILKDLAFDSIKTNYSAEKYKSIVANVGAQVFEKAIKEAVKRNWIENFPLEKKQVEEVISQSIDALPQIIDWKNQSEEMRILFIDGHVRRLLHNLNVEGWGSEQLNEIFETEVNKRIAAAAMAEAKGMLSNLPPGKEYLKYTSTVLLAAGETLLKPSSK